MVDHLARNIYLYFLLLVFVLFIGWSINIYELFQLEEIMSGEGAIRIVGIFLFPLGAILGYVI